tara:strand:- start:259 stop:555 length:297 start_codon:yes stop_codon:yes gene_type:complete
MVLEMFEQREEYDEGMRDYIEAQHFKYQGLRAIGDLCLAAAGSLAIASYTLEDPMMCFNTLLFMSVGGCIRNMARLAARDTEQRLEHVALGGGIDGNA